MHPVFHELDWRRVAEGGMTAFPVVEHLDVFEHVGFGRLPGGIPGTVHPLVLQAVEEALGGRGIPAVALVAHGTDHAVSGELVLESAACVLATSIGVVYRVFPARMRKWAMDGVFTEPGGLTGGARRCNSRAASSGDCERLLWSAFATPRGN